MTDLAQALRVQAAMRSQAQVQSRRKLVKAWPRPKWPHEARLQYYRVLLWMVERTQYVIRRDLFPKLQGILASHNATRPVNEQRTDAAGGEIDDAVAEVQASVEQAVPATTIEMQAQKNVLRVTKWNGDELSKQIRQVANINLFDDNAGLAQHLEVAVADNVRLITSLTTGQLEDVKGIITRGARQGLHHSAVAEQLVERFQFSKNRAALIATDQVGKLNGELNQIRQQNLGVRRYRWSSSQDERVRKKHRELNGTIQEWNKPPVVDDRTGERGHPGQPIRCRCQPIPIIDDVLVDAGLMDPSEVELGHPTPNAQLPVPPPPPPNVPSIPPLPPLPPPPPDQPPVPPPAPPVPPPAPPVPPPAPPVPPPAPPLPEPALPPMPPTLPQPPPANVPKPPKPKAKKKPPKPKALPKPKKPPTPKTALSREENKKWLDALHRGFGKLGPQGGTAAEVRGNVREALRRYGIEETKGYHASNELSISKAPGNNPNALAVHYSSSGRMEISEKQAKLLKESLAKLSEGKVAGWDEIDALSTLIHEEIHGTGGRRALGTYYKVGILVEEVATETMARAVVRDVLNTKVAADLPLHHPLALPRQMMRGDWTTSRRAYDTLIGGVLEDIEAVTSWPAEQVTSALEEAARAFKASRADLAKPNSLAEKFANSVPGMSAQQRLDFVAKLIARGLNVKSA